MEKNCTTFCIHLRKKIIPRCFRVLPSWVPPICSCRIQEQTPGKLDDTSSDEDAENNSFVSAWTPDDTYVRLANLVPGIEAECSVARSRTSGELVVIKHTNANTPQVGGGKATGRRKATPNDVRMLRNLKPHPNIIQLLGVDYDTGTGRHSIFLEFCRGGDLLEQLSVFEIDKITSPEVFTLHVFVSLAQALAYLHRGLTYVGGLVKYRRDSHHRPMIHGDIKPDNVLLRWPGRQNGLPDVVLGDFGHAQLAAESHGITGTRNYHPPEVAEVAALEEKDSAAYERRMNSKIVTSRCDVYQLGLIVHMMATNREFPTWGDSSGIELLPTHQDIPRLTAAIVWCLATEPEERPEMSYNVEHGLLEAVDTMRRKRDRLLPRSEKMLQEVPWNKSKIRGGPSAS